MINVLVGFEQGSQEMQVGDLAVTGQEQQAAVVSLILILVFGHPQCHLFFLFIYFYFFTYFKKYVYSSLGLLCTVVNYFVVSLSREPQYMESPGLSSLCFWLQLS